MAILNPLTQIKSLFQLPGALRQKKEAEAQAKAVEARLATFQPKPTIPATEPPKLGNIGLPSITPTNDDLKAQIAALRGQIASFQQPPQVQPQIQPQVQPQEDRLKVLEEALISAQTPTVEEEETQKRLNQLIASGELGLAKVQDQPIPLELITGQAAALRRMIQAESVPLTQQLALAQSKRQAALDVSKTRLDIEEKRFERTKPNEEKISEFTDAEGQRIVTFQDKKTGKTRQEILGKTKPETTQTERDRAIKTAAISRARPMLITSRGKDGYVDPGVYMKLRSDYAEVIGDVKEFDALFSPMLSPDERARLFSLKSVPQVRGGSVISNPFE